MMTATDATIAPLLLLVMAPRTCLAHRNDRAPLQVHLLLTLVFKEMVLLARQHRARLHLHPVKITETTDATQVLRLLQATAHHTMTMADRLIPITTVGHRLHMTATALLPVGRSVPVVLRMMLIATTESMTATNVIGMKTVCVD